MGRYKQIWICLRCGEKMEEGRKGVRKHECKPKGYKCVNCGVIKEPGSLAWQVIIYEPRQNFVPTCSEKCACELRDKNLGKFENIVNTLKNQCFQKMEWK